MTNETTMTGAELRYIRSDGEFRDLEALVLRWARDRKIIPNSTPLAQARKALEEAGELVEATTAYPYTGDKAPVVDALGDVLVCLINCAALAEIDLMDALAHAYEQIKDRKGTLLPNGVFQKEAAPQATGTEARVCADIANRQAMGTAKYGTTVEGNPANLREWLNHQYEELLDAAIYARRAIEQLDRTAEGGK